MYNSTVESQGATGTPLVAIIGPTAVGKSALALRLAEIFGGEIITADSRQVYRYMDIGTDKPGPPERARVPHHMLDLVNPDKPFTLALFQEGAAGVIKDLAQRAKLPILAGGTPLYVNAVLEGWTVPRVEPNQALRLALEAEAEQAGPELLHERLRELDPDAAQRILPSNTRRIIRALEVIEATGQPISRQQGKLTPTYNILSIGLSCERAELFRRIDARVDRQIERGLVEEVRALHDRGYSFDLPSMSGLGYRQIGAYLQGRATLGEAVQRIKWDTHAFVRHQQNWFRRARMTHWIDVTNQDPTAEAIHRVTAFLRRLSRQRKLGADSV